MMSDPNEAIPVQMREMAQTSQRGLRSFPKLAGITGGYVDCQESSLATEPAIWLTVRGFNETSMATVQISRPYARELARQLNDLAANHYQVRGEDA